MFALALSLLPSLSSVFSVLTKIPGIFSFLVNNWKMILIGFACAALAVFVWDWDHRGVESATLEQQNAVLKGNAAVLHQEQYDAHVADVAAAARIKAHQKIVTQANHISQEAHRAPATPIDPAVRDSLRQLRGLRANSGS